MKRKRHAPTVKPAPQTSTEVAQAYEERLRPTQLIAGWQTLGNGQRRKMMPKRRAAE